MNDEIVEPAPQTETVETVDYTGALQEISDNLLLLQDLILANHEDTQQDLFTYREKLELDRLEYLEIIESQNTYQKEFDRDLKNYNDSIINELITVNDSLGFDSELATRELLSIQNEKIDLLNENLSLVSETIEPAPIVLENQQLERYAYLSIILVVTAIIPVTFLYRFYMFFFNKLF